MASGLSTRASAPGAPPASTFAVLLAEHDPDVAELARRYLTRAGADVTITTGADETVAALAARTASVAVLDLTMPGLDPRRLRRLLTTPSRQPQTPQPSRLPALFLLSASMRPRDLRIAADACLWRPFSPRLLVARVLAIAPHPSPPPSKAPAAGPPTTAPTPTAPLTPAESALLSALAAHPGRVLSRGRLQAILGRSTPGHPAPGHPASGRAIDVHVSQLRAKLPDPGVLRTVRGVGYILDQPSQEASHEPPGQVGPRPGRPGSQP
ncbi:MAG: response regulator transcription factor [Actinobacteria bacterium]|nr:response regulator transcription factor [Actinomycetota bacterium]